MENIKTPKKLVDLFNEPKKDTLKKDKDKVLNPKTKRLISKNGEVYKKLVKEGVIEDTSKMEKLAQYYKEQKEKKLAKKASSPQSPTPPPPPKVLEHISKNIGLQLRKKYPNGVPATLQNIRNIKNKLVELGKTYEIKEYWEKMIYDSDVRKLEELSNPIILKEEIDLANKRTGHQKDFVEMINTFNWYFITPIDERPKDPNEGFVPPPPLGTKIGKGLNKDYLHQKWDGPHKKYIKGKTLFYK